MRVLLFGGAGQLGSEIRQCWGADVVAPTHAEADIADSVAVRNLVEPTYDLVVNCAAYHNVDACEAHPEEAFRYNAIAVGAIARLCAERSVDFLTISTDYVFNGNADRPYRETDAADPAQVYGVSKLAGELLVKQSGARAFVVRTCGVYGTGVSRTKGYTFIDRVLNQLRAGENVKVVSDVIASPTYAKHLARALWQLVQSETYGLYHAVNAGSVSWHEFAAEAALQAGIDRPIEAISASSWETNAKRPQYSALANERLDSIGIALPTWRDGIRAYLKDKEGS